VSSSGKSTWYQDSDGDGWCTTTSTTACDLPDGYAEYKADCDDTDATTNNFATEQCDGVDHDCDDYYNDSKDCGTWPYMAILSAVLFYDSQPDLIFPQNTAKQITILSNKNDNLTYATTTLTKDCKVLSAGTGDLDGDEDLDIIMGCNSTSGLYWFKNTGSAFSSSATQIDSSSTTLVNAPNAIATADMNKDNLVDVVVADYNLSSVLVWLNSSTGVFTKVVTVTSTLASADTLLIADVNNDGWNDIVANGTSELKWYQNDQSTSGSFSVKDIATGKFSAMDIADLDGDGNTDDLVVIDSKNKYLMLYSYGGTSWSGTTIFSNTSSIFTVNIADIDLDDEKDIVVGLYTGQVYYLEKGDGSWSTQTLIADGVSNLYGATVLDVEYDDDPDVVTLYDTGASVRWHVNGIYEFP
jgi:hypothetical protein